MNLEEDLSKHLIDSFSEDFKFVDIYKNSLEFRQLQFITSVPFLGKHPVNRSSHSKNEIKKLLNHPLLSSEKKALSFNAKKSYYYSYIGIYRILGDFEKNCNYTKRWIEFIEKDSAHLQTHSLDYIEGMVRLLTYHYMLKRGDELLRCYNKVNAFFTTLPQKLKTKKCNTLILKSNVIQLYYFAESNQFLNAEKKIQFIAKENDYQKLIDKDTLLSFYFMSSALYLIIGQYKNAVKWLNELINTNEKKIRQDLFQDAKILSIIIHYELGNIDYLIYLVKSTLNSLKKNDSKFKLDSTIVNFFQKEIIKNIDETKHALAFTQLKKEIEEIIKNPSEAKALNSFDYLVWIDSKIRKCSMAQIFNERKASR